MKKSTVVLVLLALGLGTGCASGPQTLEAKLESSAVQRNDVRNWERFMNTKLTHSYAQSARTKESAESVDLTGTGRKDGKAIVPLAAYEFVLNNNAAGTLGVIMWFNSGMQSEAPALRYSLGTEMEMLGLPNTHYATFIDGDGEATATEVRDAWSWAKDMFDQTHNVDGSCHVYGWSERTQYSRTHPKDVPGRYKEVLYDCKNPYENSRRMKVLVSSWANPMDGVRVIATVKTRCAGKRGENGEQFTDDRLCGETMTNDFTRNVEESDREWVTLTVSQSFDEPNELAVTGTYKGERQSLAPMSNTPEYSEFLKRLPPIERVAQNVVN